MSRFGKVIAVSPAIEDAVLFPGVTLNSSTTITVVGSNTDRVGLIISNNSNRDVWIKFQPFGLDDDKKGIYLFRNTNYEMPPLAIYNGEISAIAESGSPTIYVTEY